MKTDLEHSKHKKKKMSQIDKACQYDRARGDIHDAKAQTVPANRQTGPAGQMEPMAIF